MDSEAAVCMFDSDLSLGLDISDLIQFATDSDIKICEVSDSPVGSPLAPSDFSESVPPTPGFLSSHLEDVFLDFDEEMDSQLQQLMYIANKVDNGEASSAAETQTGEVASSPLSAFEDLPLTDVDVKTEPLPTVVKAKSTMKTSTASRSPYARLSKSSMMSDDSLIDLSVKDLNRLVQGMGRDQVKSLKARRRTLKNRGYAANSREKRQTHKSELEDDNKVLLDEIESLREERDRYKSERDQLLRVLAQQQQQ